MKTEELIEALLKRAEIRRQIPTRKSVQEGKPDRIADLLEEAAFHLMYHAGLSEMYMDILGNGGSDEL